MVAGVLAYWLLLDFPRSGRTKWLSEQEQRFAQWRLAAAANDEVDENGGNKEGIKDALTDVKTWALVFIQVCLLSSQTWTYFFPVCEPAYIFQAISLTHFLDHCQDSRFHQHHLPSDHCSGLRLRFLHFPGQFPHRR